MADAYNAEPKEEKETFTSDIRGIEKAADALEDNRAAEKEIVERKYKIIGGEHTTARTCHPTTPWICAARLRT